VKATPDLAFTSEADVAADVIMVALRVRAGGTANVAGGALLTCLGASAHPGADTETGAVDWGDGTARSTWPLRADETFPLACRLPQRAAAAAMSSWRSATTGAAVQSASE
jgi:hypothetical protein